MERGLLAGPEPRGQGGRCPPAWAQRCGHLCTHPCTAITTRGRRWQSRALAANHSLGTVAAQAPGRAPWGAGNREPLRAQGRSWMGWRGIRPLPSRGNPGLRSQAAREQMFARDVEGLSGQRGTGRQVTTVGSGCLEAQGGRAPGRGGCPRQRERFPEGQRAASSCTGLEFASKHQVLGRDGRRSGPVSRKSAQQGVDRCRRRGRQGQGREAGGVSRHGRSGSSPGDITVRLEKAGPDAGSCSG